MKSEIPIYLATNILEKAIQKKERIEKRTFKFRSFFIRIKVMLIKVAYNDIIADRKIVCLLCHEIYTKGGTPEKFQDRFFQYLDLLKQRKNEVEFIHLVNSFRRVLK